MKLPINYEESHWKVRQLARAEYVELQEGKCCHCGEPLDGPPPKTITEKKVTKSLFPKNFFNWPVHLHHSHETGMTIGAVHNYCNAVLWEYHGE